MKKIKIAAAIFSLLLLIAAVVVVVFLKSFDVNEYKPTIENAASEALGRELKIGSDIKLALALKPTVVMQDVALRNPDWASSKNMVTIKKVFVSFSLVDLFFGKGGKTNPNANTEIDVKLQINPTPTLRSYYNRLFSCPSPSLSCRLR